MLGPLRFEEADYHYFENILGRQLSEKEIYFLENILDLWLQKRTLLSGYFINQKDLHDGALRFKTDVEIRRVAMDGSWSFENGNIMRSFALNGAYPSHMLFCWTFLPTKTLYKKFWDKEQKKLERCGISIHSCLLTQEIERKRQGEVLVFGIDSSNHTYRTLLTGCDLYILKIPIPGVSLKHETVLRDIFLKYWKMEAIQFASVINKNWFDVIRSLISSIPRINGFKIQLHEKVKAGDAIIGLNPITLTKVKKSFSKSGYSIIRVGKILSEPKLEISFNRQSVIKWPRSIFDLSLIQDNSAMPELDNHLEKIHRKKVKKNYKYNKIIEKMIEVHNHNDQPWVSHFLIDINLMAGQNMTKIENNIGSGIRSVADAVRDLACKGGWPEQVLISAEPSSKYSVKGQYTVLEKFGLIDQTHFHFYFDRYSYAKVIGLSHNDRMEIFKKGQAGDFISLLGSLKGELNGSLYSKIVDFSISGNQRSTDIVLEYDINHVLIQALKVGVARKAQTITNGGLAMSLWLLIQDLDLGLGAKVTISRKLSLAELLFGESFGAALVIISEQDLMEFQRICMARGVPCSTIGRLQESSFLTINNRVNIPLKKR